MYDDPTPVHTDKEIMDGWLKTNLLGKTFTLKNLLNI
jgi:hypothetical protein